jgi:selenide,water dikinase
MNLGTTDHLDPIPSFATAADSLGLRQKIASHYGGPSTRIPIQSHAGCGCKISGCELQDSLRAANYIALDREFDPEDSALRPINGHRILMTVDGNPAVSRIPYLAARIAVLHAFSDIYARGGIVRYALSSVMIGEETGRETLEQLLAGIRDTALEEGAEIVNGQTIRGQDVVLSISAIGEPRGPMVLSKRGSQAGDLLMISKPIGTGVALRAIALEAASEDEELAVLEAMCTTNRFAMESALSVAVTSCTDVTGFGIIGHLAELTAGLGATVRVDSIPLIAGVGGLYDEVGASSWMTQNVDYASRTHHLRFRDPSRKWIACDPQTSGPLLVTVPRSQKIFLEKAGFTTIGVIEPEPTLSFI